MYNQYTRMIIPAIRMMPKRQSHIHLRLPPNSLCIEHQGRNGALRVYSSSTEYTLSIDYIHTVGLETTFSF